MKTDRIYLRDDDADGKEKGDEKVDDGDEDDEDDEDDEEKEDSTIVSEKKNLEVCGPSDNSLSRFNVNAVSCLTLVQILRWAKHVVNIITPPNNPLEKRYSDIKSQYSKSLAGYIPLFPHPRSICCLRSISILTRDNSC